MSETQIKAKEDILAFLFAGKAQFTLRSRKTNEHFTYRVIKSRHPDVKDHYFVHVGNYKSHGYIGDVFRNSLRFVQRTYTRHGTYILPFKWFLNHLDDEQVELFHTGHCGKCGRKLTDPTSISRGLGPECAQMKHQKLHDVNLSELFR